MGLYGALVEDHTHYSQILKRNKDYRIMKPPMYDYETTRYPVLYWFHGHFGSSTQTTYRRDFENYVNYHNLIVVNVDGTNGDGTWWEYDNAFEPGYYEGTAVRQNQFYAAYFRELVAHIDATFRTIADRDHRAVAGQSRGGYMAPWVAGQNKDLVGVSGGFSMSPDAARVGPVGKKVHFPLLQLYRSLKGVPGRYTSARGDRYKAYGTEMRAQWEMTDLAPEYHLHIADFHTHKAVDIPEHCDWMMAEFDKQHPVPNNWHHGDPFTDFTVWGYQVAATRSVSALTMLENVTKRGLLIGGRAYVPDGPFVQTELIQVTTDGIYDAGQSYTLIDYNRTSGAISSSAVKANGRGQIQFSVNSGGHAIGLSGTGDGAHIFLIPRHNREEHFYEVGKDASFNFTLVNVGAAASGPIQIRAFTPKPFLSLTNSQITVASLPSGAKTEVNGQITLRMTGYDVPHPDSSGWVTRLSLELNYDGGIKDTQNILVFPFPAAPYVTDPNDIIIMDGRSATFSSFNQQSHSVYQKTVVAGSGDGDGVLEPGEEGVFRVRLPQGMVRQDRQSYHPAYLLNIHDNPYAEARTEFIKREREYGYSDAAGFRSRVKIASNTPVGATVCLLFRLEAYNFSREVSGDDAIQRHAYFYRKVGITIGQPGVNVSGDGISGSSSEPVTIP